MDPAGKRPRGLLCADDRACFFGVSLDPEDEATGRVTNRIPGYRHFWDFDPTASRRQGVADKAARPPA